MREPNVSTPRKHDSHETAALIAGIAATVLSGFSLVDQRARFGVALVGAYVALSPFLLSSTLLEKVVTVTWGVARFVVSSFHAQRMFGLGFLKTNFVPSA